MQTKHSLVDLHCHILPGVDDGAADLEVSEAMLRMECAQGIRRIIFTPHFYPEDMLLEPFLEARRHAFQRIEWQCRNAQIDVKLGAEVRMAPELTAETLQQLSLGGGSYVLVELPFYGFPLWGDDFVAKMRRCGLVPVFAHVERYEYMLSNPEQMSVWRSAGALFQINASALLTSALCRKMKKLIHADLVQIVASDAHNLTSRPPRLADAMACLRSSDRDRLLWNATCIFEGRPIENAETHR